jgi:hypothetical protein
MNWHVDEGLQTLADQWRKKYPGAVVYFIGDLRHQHSDSDHNPEDAGSAPGADAGEVDAGDFMPAGGVTMDDLAELRRQLLEARDPRLLYVIFKDMIVSSVVQPWKVRKYTGKYHHHLHVSVNDRYDRNVTPWDITDDKGKPMQYVNLDGRKPLLTIGSEDQEVSHIKRLQGAVSAMTGIDLDTDGVYGARTAAAVAKLMRDDPLRTTSNGSKVAAPEWKRILGLW